MKSDLSISQMFPKKMEIALKDPGLARKSSGNTIGRIFRNRESFSLKQCKYYFVSCFIEKDAVHILNTKMALPSHDVISNLE